MSATVEASAPDSALALRARFVRLLVAWGLFFAATPGVLTRDGSLILAVLGVGVFGATVLLSSGATPKRTLAVELAANTLGNVVLFQWVRYVAPGGMVYVAFIVALWVTVGGALMRAFSRRFPTSLSVALGWLGAEILRTAVPLPFGLGWFLLGHFSHHHTWLAGSARVWGIEGLSLVVATMGGGVASAILRRKHRGRIRSDSPVVAAGVVAVALGLGVFLAGVTAPPATVDGPRVLIIQPGVEQGDKLYADPRTIHDRTVRQTLAALGASLQRGEVPDLVCWGETMLMFTLVEPEVGPALRSGKRVPEWRRPLDLEGMARYVDDENIEVRRNLLRRFPPGTSFLTGAVVLDEVGDEIRRRNAIALYDSRGRRASVASKRQLVPGAETMYGLERLPWVRETAHALIGYIPDFIPGAETTVFELPFEASPTGANEPARASGPIRFGATACFDNAFLEPYLEPLAAGPLDFHLIVSNEAWYRGSFEMDQMMAFSRIACLASGRAMVRATNDGISAVIGPGGHTVGRLEVDGKDRMVAGTLSAVVPVPVDAAAPPTPYTRLRTALRIGLLLLLCALFVLSRDRAGASGNRSMSTG